MLLRDRNDLQKKYELYLNDLEIVGNEKTNNFQ